MREYEVVGVLDADVAAQMATDQTTIVVEHDNPDKRLLARPKGGETV